MAGWLCSTMYCGTSPSFTFIFLERKSTVNFFCRMALPLYFSFVRMLSMVLVCHLDFPRGVGMPFAVRWLAIQLTVFP